MPVYTHKPIRCTPTAYWKCNRVSQLIADSPGQLVVFATTIGLKKEHIQTSDALPPMFHFDMIPEMYRKAVAKGAKSLPHALFIQKMSEIREKAIGEYKEDMIKVHRVAKILGVTKKRVYQLVDDGTLHSMQLGERDLRITRRSVRSYAHSGRMRKEVARPDLL